MRVNFNYIDGDYGVYKTKMTESGKRTHEAMIDPRVGDRFHENLAPIWEVTTPC